VDPMHIDGSTHETCNSSAFPRMRGCRLNASGGYDYQFIYSFEHSLGSTLGLASLASLASQSR